MDAKLFYKEEPKPEIAFGGAAPSAPGAFPALEIHPHMLAFATYDILFHGSTGVSNSSRVSRAPIARKHGTHLTI